MKFTYPHVPTMFILTVLMLFFNSCAKDTDIFLDAVLEPEEEVLDTDGNSEPNTDDDDETSTVTDPDSAKGTPGWFDSAPEAIRPEEGLSYTPSSSAEITNPSNAGKVAIISNSFNCDGCIFAENQIIVPSGGAISGFNINLNGSYIDEIAEQAFSPNATFISIYEDSWVFPEVFGAVANDQGDDYAAIQAGMENVKFFKNQSNGRYIRNDSDFLNRSGQFIWDLNGGKVEVTNNSNFNDGAFLKAVFWTLNLSWKVIDGTLDGTNTYGGCFYMVGPEAYHFEDLVIENWRSTTNYRAKAIHVPIWTEEGHFFSGGEPFGTSKAVTSMFTNGFMNNCIIRNIEATGDCEFNNVPSGVSKGFWMEYEEIDPSHVAEVYHSNNQIYDILGEDAEGFYLDDRTFGGNAQNPTRVNQHNIAVTLFNETIRDCHRRAAKITVSNVTLDQCRFEFISAAKANKAVGTLVDFFVFNSSSYPTDRNTNIIVKDCEFIQSDILPERDNGCGGFIPDVPMLGFLDTENTLVTGNRFERPDLDNYAAVRVGNRINNMVFENNTYVNVGFEFLNFWDATNDLTVRNESFNYDINGTGGAASAVFRALGFSSNDVITGLNIDNLDITMNNTAAGFRGLLYSKGAAFENNTFSNIQISYNDSPIDQAFGLLEGNFGSSNIIDNCDISGAVGTGALVIMGPSKNPVITNSTGDNTTGLTVN